MPDSRSLIHLFRRDRRRTVKNEFTGSCPIREHTGDGAYVGRCDFATYDRVCPRHGWLNDYPNNDDREVAVLDRRFAPEGLS